MKPKNQFPRWRYKKSGNGIKPEIAEADALIGLYREELRGHDICIQSYERLTRAHGLINIIENYILTETGIGDGCIMCGFSFPNIWSAWEADDPDYFSGGVRFNFTPEGWAEVINYKELVRLVEDSCLNYLRKNPLDTDKINDLLKQVKEKFAEK